MPKKRKTKLSHLTPDAKRQRKRRSALYDQKREMQLAKTNNRLAQLMEGESPFQSSITNASRFWSEEEHSTLNYVPCVDFKNDPSVSTKDSHFIIPKKRKTNFSHYTPGAKRQRKKRSTVNVQKREMQLAKTKNRLVQLMEVKGAKEEHHGHSHEHGHTHEHLVSPGTFLSREMPPSRKDFRKRAFTVGIGGPVGSGKTALVLALSKVMREKHNLCIVTNDIFTREDWEFLVKNEALPKDRIRAVQTGGCPHAAIREDYSLNLQVVKDLTEEYRPEIVFIESGGDNLAANFSRDLADYIIYVIDVAGGDKIPRKGGPGITESDLLVINKADLAMAVGADLKVMTSEAHLMRQGGPSILTQAKHMIGIEDVVEHIVKAYKEAYKKSFYLG